MTKLHQILAVSSDAAAQCAAVITGAYHRIQANTDLFAGLAKTYDPKDELGDTFPPSSTKVRYRSTDLLAEATVAWVRLLDVTATKDWANCEAKADVVIDGVTIMAQAPVSYLLYLEKRLQDVRTFVSKLPTLDPSYDWTTNPDGDWASPVVITTKTKKVPVVLVKAEATQHHPAQTEVLYEDVVEGRWNTTRFSGAMPGTRRDELLQRINRLTEAVKMAREEANSIDITNQHVGQAFFDYLLA